MRLSIPSLSPRSPVGGGGPPQPPPKDRPAASSTPSCDPADGDPSADQPCAVCGATSFIHDAQTGVARCSVCHTESLTASQLEVMGADDVEAVAARTGGGRLLSRRRRPGRPAGGRMEADLDEEADRSVPLPPLEPCVLAYQHALRAAAERVGELAGIGGGGGAGSEPGPGSPLVEAVGECWFGYLEAWREGALEQARYHPEVRFSLRDSFLGRRRRYLILRHLSAKARAELEAEADEEGRRGGRGAKRRRGGAATGGQNRDRSGWGGATYSSVGAMLGSLPRTAMMTAPLAALHLEPSLTLLAAILHLSLMKLGAGVAAHHLSGWAASGELPQLTDAWRCLPEEARAGVSPVRSFFGPALPPPPGAIEYQADLLNIACGWNLRRDGGGGIEGLGGEGGSVDNVALMAYRLVSDLGYPQRVLDLALSLMGLRRANEGGGEWFPLPLEAASPGRLTSPLHIMAVICVAVRMCQGWEGWTYHRGGGGDLPSMRFIPAGDNQLNLLGNGPELNGYLNHVEKHCFDRETRISPFGPFLDGLLRKGRVGARGEGRRGTKHRLRGAKAEAKPSSIAVNPASDLAPAPAVLPNTVVAGAAIPSARGAEKEDRAEWAEANGIGKYVLYRSSLSRRLGNNASTDGMPGSEPLPFHPHYGLLIEYLSYMADAEPSDLQSLVSELDTEIFQRSCWDNVEAMESAPDNLRKKNHAYRDFMAQQRSKAKSQYIYPPLAAWERERRGSKDKDD